MVGLATKSKTLRLPDDVIDMIDKYPGDTFTEKFITCVRLCDQRRDDVQREIVRLEKRRDALRQSVCDVGTLETQRRRLDTLMQQINWKVSEAMRIANTLHQDVNDYTANCIDVLGRDT